MFGWLKRQPPPPIVDLTDEEMALGPQEYIDDGSEDVVLADPPEWEENLRASLRKRDDRVREHLTKQIVIRYTLKPKGEKTAVKNVAIYHKISRELVATVSVDFDNQEIVCTIGGAHAATVDSDDVQVISLPPLPASASSPTSSCHRSPDTAEAG